MSIQNNFPAIRPSLNLDFANTKELDPRITFARASTATYYGTQTAKAEENLLLWSQDFQQTGWLLTASTIAANNQTAPDGTTTADTLTFAGGGASCRISRNITASALDTTRSVFVKAGTTSFVQFLSSGDANAFANFDVSTGTVGTVGSGVTASAISVGSGWYRLVMAFAKAGATEFRVQGIDSNTAAYGSTLTTGGTVFLWGAQLEQRSAVTDYTPTTTQPITNYIPVLETAASGVARFDHNPTTFESLGFLVEEQRTNLVTYSEQFDDAAWSKSGTTITANTIVAPDGTLTGDKLVENTSSGIQHRIGQSIATTTNQTYTFTFYAKAGETPEFVAQIVASGSSATTSSIGFAITDGVISPFGIAGIVSSSSAQAVGNGWYRCSVVYTLNGTVTDHQVRIFPRSTASYTGDGYSGVYIWGAQLEAGAFPTSYVKTEASQVTRAADSASMTEANFSSWYRADEGTLYAEWQKFAPSSFQAIALASDGTTLNVIALGHGSISGSNNSLRFDVNVGNVSQVQITTIANTPSNTFAKTAAAYAVNDFSVVSNGGANGTDTSGVLPVVNRLSIGANSINTGGFLNGTIRKLSFYSKRLSNVELQGLTS